MFSMSEGMAEFLTVIVELLVVAIPVAALCWFVVWLARRGNKPAVAPDFGLDLAEQLRTLQDQLEDAHVRIDSAEHLIAEQREQLRDLGGHPHRAVDIDHPTPA